MREDGFYWVRFKGEWEVACWAAKNWYCAGLDYWMPDETFEEIDERRIERQCWQPMETAPKDGTKVDLWTQWGRYNDCSWEHHNWLNGQPRGEKSWFTPKQTLSGELEPMGWMLPPLPPQATP